MLRLFCLGVLVVAEAACSLVVDRGRFEDGGGATGGLGTSASSVVTTSEGATTSSSTGTATVTSAGGGGAGGAGTCVPVLFHVGFDEPTTDSWYGSVLVTHGNMLGSLVSTPVRSGAGAWQIDMDTQKESTLRTDVVEEDQEVWFGFSALFETNTPSDSSSILHIGCTVPAPTYLSNQFVLSTDKATPGQPFGYYAPGSRSTPDLNQLGQIPFGPMMFGDWAFHLRLSRTGRGLVEIYFDGTKRFSMSGPNIEDACNGTYFLDTGVVRYASRPAPWSVVIDEMTLLQAPSDPFTEADVLYTLAPGHCF